ncbi:MAG TPA: amidase family protein, partial [Myxococcales bacterium]|nr:amidase family protein [Myxococcales bacterium]
MNRRYLLVSVLFALAALALPATADDDDHGQFKVVEATIADIQAAFRSGDLTPEDLVKIYLARIAAFDRANDQPLNGGVGTQPFNAFMHVNQSAGRDDGDDEEGDDDGGGRSLSGIPVILKDNIATKDMPTTAGSVALGNSRPKKDATIARKLRRAGAIILGKGTLTEFANFIALGMPTGFSSQLRFQLFQGGGDLSKVGFGFNSYDPRLDPRPIIPVNIKNDGRPILATGGSSSGPGIAVGANLATVGVGTETSGSILSPSGQNSLAGIKPTLGLVSRHGIVPITADQDTAGPMARTVTDAAKLLGVLAGFDPKDPATDACRTPGKCFRNYTKFLNPNALQGAHIAVPKHPYWIEFGLGAARTALMNDAIATMTSLGATVETCEIPSQDVLNNYGTCVTSADVAARRATPAGTIPPCSTVLMFGFRRDLNSYLADKDFGPGVSASNAQIPVRTVNTLSDVISFNGAHPEVALKYGQAIAVGSDTLNTGPGDDLRNYQADRALDLQLTRTCGLDVLYTGVVPDSCRGL